MTPDDILRARHAARWTQPDLSQHMGVSVRSIQRYEAGGPIPPKTRKRLAAWVADVLSPTLTSFADRVRMLRSSVGLTQSQLAFGLGRSEREIDDVEAGRWTPAAADWPEIYHWVCGDAVLSASDEGHDLRWVAGLDSRTLTESAELMDAFHEGKLLPVPLGGRATRFMPVEKIAGPRVGVTEFAVLDGVEITESTGRNLTPFTAHATNDRMNLVIERKVRDRSPIPDKFEVRANVNEQDVAWLDRMAGRHDAPRSEIVRAIVKAARRMLEDQG